MNPRPSTASDQRMLASPERFQGFASVLAHIRLRPLCNDAIVSENVLVNRIIRFFLLVGNKPDLPGQASLNRISRFVSFAHPRHVAIEREGKAATSSRVQDRISLQRRKRIAARSARVRDENAAVSSVRRCVRGNMALRSHRPGRRIGQRWEPT